MEININIEHLQQTVRFTPAEVRTIGYLLDGGPSNLEIAARIEASSGRPCCHRTIQAHMTNILSKTELGNRTALALWAVRQPEFSRLA